MAFVSVDAIAQLEACAKSLSQINIDLRQEAKDSAFSGITLNGLQTTGKTSTYRQQKVGRDGGIW